MGTYLEDILSQPQQLQTALAVYTGSDVRRSLETIHKMEFSELIFAGMGSSHFCALSANVYLAGHGIRSQVISAGELLHYEYGRIKTDTLLCLISQSGESAEIVRLLKKLPDDIQVIAITNNPESTLGKRGNVTLPLCVSDEKSVTTRTYLASVCLTLLIAFTMTGEDMDEVFKELRKVYGEMGQYLEDFECNTKKLADFSLNSKEINVMGRGYAITAVRAGALFFREVARYGTTDFDSAEFRHGPMETVDDGFFGIVLAPFGNTQMLGIHLAREIAEKGGRVVLVTDAGAPDQKWGDNILPVILPEVPEIYSPFLQILPLQLLADALAKEKGIVAGDFRWGSKITAVE